MAVGRKNQLFMGSEGGGKAGDIAYTLIETAEFNGVDLHVWLSDVLGRIAEHKTPGSTRCCPGPTLNVVERTGDRQTLPGGLARTLSILPPAMSWNSPSVRPGKATTFIPVRSVPLRPWSGDGHGDRDPGDPYAENRSDTETDVPIPGVLCSAIVPL
ncbi:MAG: transposase domain-containing protein [Thalassobaculum sp.]